MLTYVIIFGIKKEKIVKIIVCIVEKHQNCLKNCLVSKHYR